MRPSDSELLDVLQDLLDEANHRGNVITFGDVETRAVRIKDELAEIHERLRSGELIAGVVSSLQRK